MRAWSAASALALALALSAAACERGSSSGAVAQEDDPFDQRWAKASEQVSPMEVQAAELAGDVTGAPGLVTEAVAGDADQGPLAYEEVTRYVRTKMGTIQTCYHRASRSHPGLGGRALLNFTITPGGDVSDVGVDAPRFGGTDLGSCLESRVKTWRFRPHEGEPLAASYPLLFVSH